MKTIYDKVGLSILALLGFFVLSTVYVGMCLQDVEAHLILPLVLAFVIGGYAVAFQYFPRAAFYGVYSASLIFLISRYIYSGITDGGFFISLGLILPVCAFLIVSAVKDNRAPVKIMSDSKSLFTGSLPFLLALYIIQSRFFGLGTGSTSLPYEVQVAVGIVIMWISSFLVFSYVVCVAHWTASKEKSIFASLLFARSSAGTTTLLALPMLIVCGLSFDRFSSSYIVPPLNLLLLVVIARCCALYGLQQGTLVDALKAFSKFTFSSGILPIHSLNVEFSSMIVFTAAFTAYDKTAALIRNFPRGIYMAFFTTVIFGLVSHFMFLCIITSSKQFLEQSGDLAVSEKSESEQSVEVIEQSTVSKAVKSAESSV